MLIYYYYIHVFELYTSKYLENKIFLRISISLYIKRDAETSENLFRISLHIDHMEKLTSFTTTFMKIN